MAQITEAVQKTLDFAKEVAGAAFAEAGKGDTTLMNRFSKRSDGMAFYFNNVMRGALSPEQFAAQYPPYIKDIEAFREEYERSLKADANDTRLTKIEEGLATLQTSIAALVEAQKPAAPAAKPGRKAKQNDPEPEAETGEEETPDAPETEA